MNFRLRPDADEEEFKAADRRVQTRFAYHRAGLHRRTTARSAGGEWIVISLWRSAHDADTSADAARRDDSTAGFAALVEASSVRTERYDTLD